MGLRKADIPKTAGEGIYTEIGCPLNILLPLYCHHNRMISRQGGCFLYFLLLWCRWYWASLGNFQSLKIAQSDCFWSLSLPAIQLSLCQAAGQNMVKSNIDAKKIKIDSVQLCSPVLRVALLIGIAIWTADQNTSLPDRSDKGAHKSYNRMGLLFGIFRMPLLSADKPWVCK